MARKRTYIRAWREKKGLTLDQMVGRLDEIGVKITGASLSRIERGIQPYSQDIIEAIAESLELTVSQLVEHDPHIEKSEVIDFVQHLDAKQSRQARDVLRAMFGNRA
jgi:transcriptional regulator with XRE-family HTH domain